MKPKLLLIPYLVMIVMIAIIAMLSCRNVKPEQEKRKYRIARIEIQPGFLKQYRIELAEHARIAVEVEPGVLSLQAVYDQANPSRVTVFEVYASEEAYQSHLKTAHFLKYKNGTAKMVKSLELIEVSPIGIEIKPELIKKNE